MNGRDDPVSPRPGRERGDVRVVAPRGPEDVPSRSILQAPASRPQIGRPTPDSRVPMCFPPPPVPAGPSPFDRAAWRSPGCPRCRCWARFGDSPKGCPPPKANSYPVVTWIQTCYPHIFKVGGFPPRGVPPGGHEAAAGSPMIRSPTETPVGSNARSSLFAPIVPIIHTLKGDWPQVRPRPIVRP